MFDTRGDPEERNDLAERETRLADEMEWGLRESIIEMEARSKRTEVTRAISDEELQTLRSLGYLR